MGHRGGDHLQIEVQMDTERGGRLGKENEENGEHRPVCIRASSARWGGEKYFEARVAGDEVDSKGKALQEHSPDLDPQE